MKVFSNILITLFAVIVAVMLGALIYKLFFTNKVNPNLDNNIEKVSSSEVIQINILNASGAKGIAGKVKDYLRSRGFDVVEIGNYTKLIDNSFILDRIGDSSSSARVAEAIGIPDSLIKKKIDSTLFLRASVILGKDYEKLRAFKN